MSDRPLLMGNSIVYNGPWVPLHPEATKIEVEGMAEGDELLIQVRDVDEQVADFKLILNEDAEIDISSAKPALVRACRLRTSGREIFVWVS